MKEGWELKKLGEVCDFIRGPFGGSLKKNCFKKSGYAVYEQQHAIYGDFTFRYFIDESKFQEMKRFEVLPQDIIMSCSGTMGKISIVPDETPKGIINQALLKLTVKKNLLNVFLKYWMESVVFQEELTKYSKGAAIQNIASVKVLKDIQINLPPLSEQQHIVEILDTAFAKIDTVKQNAERNLQNAKELFQSVLTNSYNNKSDFEYLKYLASIKTGKLNANAAVENGIYPFFTCSREVYSIGKYAFDCEALLLAGNNASGDFNVKHYKGKFNAYQRTYVITVNTQKLAYRYLYYRLLLSLSELKKDANGTNTKFIKLGMIESITIPKISLSDQQQIVSKLDALSAKCKELENNYLKTINDCDELKKAILAKAFNGEL